MLKLSTYKGKQKLGAITTEVAIGLGLSIVVLIVVIGLFGENLSNIITNSGISNMFDNTNKTTYNSFNRDYTASQINVQLVGEQGLAMLRNIANNKAITQIDKFFDGSDTSVTNKNSIGYLAIVINAIVGSPDICVYMKKDSDKTCDKDNIGGYLYKVVLNGNTLTITKIGDGIGAKTLDMSGDFTSGASGITIKAFSSGGALRSFNPMSMLSANYTPSSIEQTSIYTYIKELSGFADQSNTVYDYDILIKAINAGKATPNAMTPEQVKTALIKFLTGSTDLTNPTGSGGIVDNMQQAHNRCTGYSPFDSTDDLDIPRADGPYSSDQCGTPLWPWSENFVYLDDISKTQRYANTFATIISGETSQNILDIVNTLLSQPNLSDFIDSLRQDHIKDSCGEFIRALQNIASANKVNIPIPACVPN